MSDPNWLKEPDPSGDAVVYVSIPKDAKLNPEIREALNQLSKALQEVDKITPDRGIKCPDYEWCSLENCRPFDAKPCFDLVSCRIKS
jgi:hypothetical protein